MNDADAYESSDTFVFSEDELPASEVGQSCSQILYKVVKDQLNLNVSRSDISTAHRIGKKSIQQQSYRRNIVAKLCCRELKADLLNASRQLNPIFFY